MKVRAKKGIAVARVSTKDQSQDERYSLAVQKKRLLEYVQQMGFELIGSVREVIESAHKGKRQEFMKILKEVEQMNEPVALFLYDVSRFSRDSSSKVMLETDRLRKEGKLELHFVYDRIVIHKDSKVSEEDRWRTEVQRHWYDSARKSERVKEVIEWKLNQGHYPSYTPTGYKNEVTIVNGNIHKEIVIDTPRAKLIKEAYRKYASGDYSQEELVRWLRKQGFTMKGKRTKRNPEGKDLPITKGGLQHMLQEVFYTGKFWFTNPVTGERKLWKATNYEPIISEELYEKVQKMLKKKAIKYKAFHDYSSVKFFKYRGLIQCGFCGSLMSPKDKSGDSKYKNCSGIFYVCTHGHKNSNPDYYKEKFGVNHSGVKNWKGKKVVNCPQKMVTEEWIEKQVKHYLEFFHYDKKVYKELRKALKGDYESQMSIMAIEKENIEREIRQKEKEEKNLVAVLAKDPDFDSISTFKEKMIDLRSEIDKLKNQLDVLKEHQEVQIDDFVDSMVICSDLSKQFDKLPDDKKRDLVMLIFSNIEIKVGKVGKKEYEDLSLFLHNEELEELIVKGLPEWLKKHERTKSTGGLFKKVVYVDDDDDDDNDDENNGGGGTGGDGSKVKIELREPDVVGSEDCVSTV